MKVHMIFGQVKDRNSRHQAANFLAKEDIVTRVHKAWCIANALWGALWGAGRGSGEQGGIPQVAQPDTTELGSLLYDFGGRNIPKQVKVTKPLALAKGP